MAASVSTSEKKHLHIQSTVKMLFILTVHSYAFLPYLHNLSYRLTELNVSLLLPHKTDFLQKYLIKTNTC